MAEETPSDPVVEPARMARLPRISLAWLVPLVALAVSLGVAWRTYSDRGPMIEILFDNASGIVPGDTTLRFRDFTIGLVEGVDFTADLSQVVAHVRLQRDIAPFVDSDSSFWLVRAQVGPRGITGLETVLTGVYIQASFDDVAGTPQERFTALTRPPLTPAGQAGSRVTLRSASGGSLAIGAPVLFKQIAVGKIEDVELTREGDVLVTAFIDAPHNARMTTATRFWNASGFTLEFGAGGAALRVDSLASLVQGGIAFDQVAALGAPVAESHVFRLYDAEGVARNSNLTGADWENPVRFAAIFDGTVRGLRVGSDV
jgi:paraquat-inducible protein B